MRARAIHTHTYIHTAQLSPGELRGWGAGTVSQVMFVESICNQPSVIVDNIRAVKLRSPDYVNVDPEEAAADFIKRIALYEGASWVCACACT
jgi:hypothetical protein